MHILPVAERALFELHDNYITESASGAMRILGEYDPRCVGAIHDPENMCRAGKEGWKMSLQILGDYLSHVHVKNGKWIYDEAESAWVWYRTEIDEGLVDWQQIINILKELNYDVPLVLEDIRKDVEPSVKMTRGLATLRRMVGE